MLDILEVRIASNALPAIILDDPNFVRAHTILVSAGDCSVHAVLHESDVALGTLDPKTLRELYAHEHISLSARRPDGSVLTFCSQLKMVQ